MTTLQLEPEQKQVIETEIAPVVEAARAIVVKNQEQRTAAVTFGKTLKDMRQKIEDRFHPTTNKEKAYSVYKDLIETEHAFYDDIDAAIEQLKKTIKNFDTAETKRIQAENDKLEAERKDKEEKEKQKLADKATKAEEKGDTNKAEVLRQQAETYTAPVTFTPPPAAIKKLVWKARVVNPLLACKSIGEGLIPSNAVEFKQSALNDLGKTYEANKIPVPGIEFFEEAASGRF